MQSEQSILTDVQPASGLWVFSVVHSMAIPPPSAGVAKIALFSYNVVTSSAVISELVHFLMDFELITHY